LIAAFALKKWLYGVRGARPIHIELRHGMASFTFDDFPVSALRVGGAMLEQRGWRGTYYVVGGLMGTTENGLPMCSPDDVARCVERGHEVGHHTFTHVDCPKTASAALEREFRRNFQALGALASRNFAFPFGASDFRTQQLAGAAFDSCRGNQRGINGAETDLCALKAVALYESRPLDQVLGLIGDARRLGGWIIFYTHDISAMPSPFGCTPDYFDRVATAVVREGLAVGTVAECLARLGR
jgi:peptidoglycan/xylan/chitin deacetylase (PgdA/CDA1 family)